LFHWDFGMRPECESETPPSAIPAFPVICARSRLMIAAGNAASRISSAGRDADRVARGETPVPVSGQGW
jgi:hypothetical protein